MFEKHFTSLVILLLLSISCQSQVFQPLDSKALDKVIFDPSAI